MTTEQHILAAAAIAAAVLGWANTILLILANRGRHNLALRVAALSSGALAWVATTMALLFVLWPDVRLPEDIRVLNRVSLLVVTTVPQIVFSLIWAADRFGRNGR